MKCQSCGSERVASVYAKCNDLCAVTLGEHEHDGYVPSDMGLGSGDDGVEFEYCLDCGQLQSDFPLQPTKLEGLKEHEDE